MASKCPEWQKWEEEVAEVVGGSMVKASGRFDMFKGDVKTDTAMIDCKHTDSSGYVLTAEFWKKLSMWARNEQREPIVAVSASGSRSKIAIMDEMFYDTISEIDTSEMVLEGPMHRQKTIDYKMDKFEPTLVCFKNRRLIACSFESFVSFLKLYEEAL